MNQVKIQYKLHSNLMVNGTDYDLEPVLILLKAIEEEKNLREAAHHCGYSYRKAWNLLNQMEELFGLTIVEKQRGKGTQPSSLGQNLIDITKENKQTLKSDLTIASHKANELLQSKLTKSQRLKIVASDSEKINTLRQHPLSIEIQIDGSAQALAAYAENQSDIAGFHLVIGEKNHQQLTKYIRYLDKKQDQFVLLEQRQQGIISHLDNPVESLQSIVDQQLIFVNRQTGSGTRLLFDNLLKQQKIKAENINGYYHEEHTHLAVASMIMSRQADAGLGVESAAKRLNLHFSPISSEYYFLVFKKLNTPIQNILNILSNQEKLSVINYGDFIKLARNGK